MKILHNLIINVLSKVINFVSKSKARSLNVFSKHQSTGYQNVVEEDTSQDKFRLMTSHFLSQNIILPFETKYSIKTFVF